MENIMIFAFTVIIYFTAWFVFTARFFVNINLNLMSWSKYAKVLALVTLLALPLNIDGNVFTIAGNATAEKSVYSIFSLYQRAEYDAVTIIGLVGYQEAGQDAGTVFGLAGYQKAKRDAVIGIGFAGYQKAERDAATVVGLSGYQQAKHKAELVLAIALYQRVGEKTRAFGAFSALTKD